MEDEGNTDGSSPGERVQPLSQPKDPPTPETLYQFLRDAPEARVRERVRTEIRHILDANAEHLSSYCCVAILEPEGSISAFTLDQIYGALKRLNPDRDKDVLLFALSRGGSVEPAYQIAKLCKSFANKRFIVAVPRFAKSAATLIALGADEIHMGPLGQLGPIDPQLGGLPALGVIQALETIASLSERFPKSGDMFARYLRMALTVEQIGYCERISVSAAQYADRLLSTKTGLPKTASEIARELVHEYKDHGFVIDLDEARGHLGQSWIRSDTPELLVAEAVYNLFEEVNLFYGVFQRKRIAIVGELEAVPFVFIED
jgi:hypothetical protein